MPDERTLGQLVAQASQDVSELVRFEIALAKAELKDDVIRGAAGAGLFAVAGFFTFLAIITLVITIGYALVAAGLSPWLAFLIVTAALLLLAGLFSGVGILLLKRIRPPERTIATTKETIAAVRGARGGTNGATPGPTAS